MRFKALSVLVLIALLAVALLPGAAINAQDGGSLTVTQIGAFQNGSFGEGAAEISAFDTGSANLFVTNGETDAVDILNLSDPTAPELVGSIDVTLYGAGVNSVAAANGLVAIAIEAEEVDVAGVIVLVDGEGNELAVFEAGFLPDMVTFSPDGSVIAVANEGEPNDDYTIDPEGSVTLIYLDEEDIEASEVVQVSLAGLPVEGEVRVFGPGSTPEQDYEPEYVAFSSDGLFAFVGLQENNAILVVDIEEGIARGITGLGYKDHSIEGNGFDASNRDDMINITTHPTLGMYMPDAIIVVTDEMGNDYVVTANEGDSRDYDGFSEEVRVEDLVLDEEAYPNAEELQAEENLGRLKTTTTMGDTDGDGDVDQIFSYGARSFTIWDAETGEVIWDSGDELEQITAEIDPELFNANGDELGYDDRSDDKGPEPEGLAAGWVGEEMYLFVGLERSYGFIVYNITDPTAPVFETFVVTRTNELTEDGVPAGDIGPEGLTFISADDSPTGVALLAITYEVSSNTVIYELSAE